MEDFWGYQQLGNLQMDFHENRSWNGDPLQIFSTMFRIAVVCVGKSMGGSDWNDDSKAGKEPHVSQFLNGHMKSQILDM